MSNSVIKDYILWLGNLVKLDEKEECGGYYLLIKALYKKEFYWVNDMDENRSDEGKDLRYIFADECGLDEVPDEINGACSVLEMMIGLAKRWNNEVSLTEDEDRSDEYFWQMVTNLGLEGCTDDKFDPVMVREKLDILLDRDYPDDGKGSLFPLERSKESQKNIEIWYQLQNYLIENYEF